MRIWMAFLVSLPLLACSVPASLGQTNENLAEDLFEQGQAAFRGGEPDSAIALYTEAIGADPNYAAAYVGRGGVYAVLKDYEAAIADFDQAIELDPELASAYGSRGVARYRSGDPEGIRDLWQAARLFRDQDRMEDYFKTLVIIRRLDP
ncbi:hypothetical protein XM38_048680 [Halomicronema hongdechloris C2206]|uniref:Uncharacterized protein n=1 Tax=Halomicronema hongdechloris C2206 TaxID=1641165 RepID=A0A1Z3HUB1_9CYAN|nr:tetratricopeptide repeat protein [Halomicronema hongdechloris]ASC73894.1 hypothetical protein XM38_048680 [Halomicronema hongdechloris C2206]